MRCAFSDADITGSLERARMFSMLDQLGGVEGPAPSYPPYNIERNGENASRVSVAVAGFTDAFDRSEGKHADDPWRETGQRRVHVDLVREISEAMKPRASLIASSGKVSEVQPTKAAA
jgi:hypothetical protein